MKHKLILVNKEGKVIETIEVYHSVISNIINGEISTTITTKDKSYEISAINNYEVISHGKENSEVLTLEIV